LAALVHTLASAVLFPGTGFWAAWQIIWTGRMAGVLAVTPLVLAWNEKFLQLLRQAKAGPVLEMAVLITGPFVCSLYIYIDSPNIHGENYLVMPFLVWSALRFSLRGTTLSGLLVALVSAWGTTNRLDEIALTCVILVHRDVLLSNLCFGKLSFNRKRLFFQLLSILG